MQSLFPAQPSNQGSQALYQFRAGKCQLTSQPNGKFLVQADLRRGSVVLSRGADSLVHFKWQNVSNGTVEDDRIVMPGESVFRKIKSGRDSDRVFMLKFSSGNQRFLFWMQAKDNSKDEEIVKKVNDILNNQSNATESQSQGSQPNWLTQMMG
jgi:26S proteasome regulatory subunit N13